MLGRRFWHWLAGAAMIGALLGGSAASKEVEITYYGAWGANVGGSLYIEIEKAVVDRFNELYKGRIKVSAVEVPGGPEAKLPVLVAAGTPPDLAKLDRFQVGQFASQALIEPVDDLIKSMGVNRNDYFPATWDELVYNGRTYGLPWNTDDRALYYNKTLFSQSGLDPNRPPVTWTDVDTMSRKLERQQNNQLTQVGFVPHWGNWFFVGWLWAAGGDLLDATNRKVTWQGEAGLKAIQWMQDRLHLYGGRSALDAFNGKFQRGALLGGGLAMAMDGSWNMGNVKQYGQDWEFGVAAAPVPAGMEGKPVTWSGGFALVIPKGAPHPKESFEFMKFYASQWAQVQLGANSGQLPALKSAALSSEFLQYSPFMRGFVQLMNVSRFRPVIPGGGTLWNAYVDRVHAMLVEDKMPAKQILEESARLGQQALDEAWARAQVK